MAQLSLRLSDELADRLRQAARSGGTSVNAYATAVLAAATDPDLAGDEPTRTRERLARAGLLVRPEPGPERPAQDLVARARNAAGRGQPLADIVSEDRGP